jgi:hypothetical protein
MAALSLSELNARRQTAVVILAQQSAMRAVRRQIQREGRIKLWSLSHATLTRLGNEWLRQHPELIAEAAASPILELIKCEGQLS